VGSSADIEFYFDFISHNAYLAWTQMPALAARHDRRVRPVPVLFAAMLNAHGQLGPAEVKPKREWMLRNVARKAALVGVAVNPPASHPFNPLLALRAVTQDMAEDERQRLIDRLFSAVWRDGLDVSDPAIVAGLAGETGLDGDALVAGCAAPDVKQRVRDTTAAAIAAGVFGVPSMRVGDEIFWGYDDLPLLELLLSGRDPLTAESLSPWYRVRPSAERKR